MPTLPGVRDFGSPLIPKPQRAIATISPGAAGAVGNAIAGAGNEVVNHAFRIADREATAAAKDADTAAATRIRDLLYNPENGFLNQNGQNAVNGRETTIAQLDGLLESMGEGLNTAAKRKLEDSLRGRIERAKLSIDSHTSSERETWINGASQARIESAMQDSIFNPSETENSLQVIQGEILGIAAREGWDQEQTALEMDKATSKVYADQITSAMDSDPIAAMEYLRENQNNMLPTDVANLESALRPAVESQLGRNITEEAFVAMGDMGAMLSIASDTLGMDENAQNAALKAYLNEGGVNLDPAQTAWCAAFVNATLAKAGFDGTGSNMARSFLEWGEGVTDPQKGDVVVLERGDPPWGHVGIFDGFNEDGTIRILGGNQGDAVSIEDYSPSKVLGYRRAAGSANDIDPSAVLNQILEIENPRVRKAAMDEYNLRMGVLEGQQTAQQNAAVNEVFQFIEGGGRVDDIPTNQRQAIGMTALSALRTYESKLARGGSVETDAATYLQLRTMQASNPDQFRSTNLLEYVDRLSQSDFQSFVDDQQKPASESTLNPTAASSLMTIASRQIAAAGFDTSPDAGSDDAKQLATVQTNLLRWQDDFIKENTRPPTQTDIDKRVGLELKEIVYNPSGAFNQQTTTGFEGFGDTALTVDTLQDLRTKDGVIKIDDRELPAGVVREMIGLLIDDNAEITMDNIVDKYFDVLMTYGDLPTGQTATQIWGEVQGPMPIGGG